MSYTNAKGDPTNYNYGSTASNRHLLLTIELPKGNTVTNTYMAKKLASTKTNGNQPMGYQYDRNYGQTANNDYTQTTIVNPNTNETTVIEYTKNGTPNHINQDEIIVADIIYDGTHINFPAQTTINGQTVSQSYDGDGNVLSISRPLGVTESFTYNGTNDLVTYTDPESHTYSYTRDGAGNITAVTTPRGTASYSFNAQGLVTAVTNPAGITSSFARNSYGDITGTTAPESISTSAGFDIVGRLTSFTNPNGHTRTYTRDANDNLLSETFNSRTTSYNFDPNDNLTAITNARGYVTDLEYDFGDDTLLETDFEGRKDEYTYFDDGKIATKKKPDGTVFSYQYNTTNGLLESISGGGHTVSFTYDSRNNIASVSNPNGTITYGRDALDRIISTTDYYGNTVSYQYNKNSNVTRITYPDGKQVNYTYYDDNLLHTVTDWNNQITTYSYRDDGLLLTTTYPNDTHETISYDGAGRPVGLSWKKSDGTIINEYSFGLDANGWHTSETKTEPFAPQPLTDNAADATYNSKNELTTFDGASFSHDTNGNMTSNNPDTYTWDVFDRLTGVTGNITASFEYDGNGDRRKSTVNGQTKRFVLDILGLSNVLVETDDSNNPQNYYVYGLGLISRIDAGNNTNYYHYDFRGSTIAMTDENEAITHSYQYSDFGELLQINEADYNPYRYVGKYGIQYEAGNLAFMRARYYNPVVGRFLTEDPVWSPNLYTYADNNPISKIDPSGKYSIFKSDSEKWNKIINAFIPVPVASSIETNLGVDAIFSASSSPFGWLSVIRGPDKYKTTAFTSAGAGVGALSASATKTAMAYFYYGDIDNFNISAFEGTSYDIEITGGEIITFGGIISVAQNKKHPSEFLIGIGGIYGFGVGLPISGNFTWQQTVLW